MEEIRSKLRALEDRARLSCDVTHFAEQIVGNWLADGARGGDDLHEVESTLQPILSEAGVSPADWSLFWAAVAACRATNEQISAKDVADAIVPIENPVQMNLSPLSVSMASTGKVKLDWLASKRVVTSQVDQERLEKISSRHKSRAQKRAGKAPLASADVVSSSSSARKGGAAARGGDEPAKDAKTIVDEIIAAAARNSGRARPDLILESFDVAHAGKRILTNANLLLAQGRRYGLVGRNGVGKSTLLNHLSGRKLAVAAGMSILHVEQEVIGDDTSALQSVIAADVKRTALLAEEVRIQEELLKSSTDNEAAMELTRRSQTIYTILEESEADTAEARAATILSGLGFSLADQQKATRKFSGGWRMRIALARALFCMPDLLLLDEPTNMLDFPAVVWLEGYLNDWPGTLFVVSHDRCFLDNVCTDILHMHNEQLDTYRGNYCQFLATKEERLKSQQSEYETQLEYRQHLQAFIDRWRYNANRAPQAQSRIKILEKLPPLRPVIVESPVVLRFPPVETISPPILQLDDVSFSYPQARKEITTEDGDTITVPDEEATEMPLILRNVDFNVQPGSRMAIVGPNGAGKTTLLKLLSGALEPSSGKLYRHGRLRISLFTQHHVDQLDLSLNSIEMLKVRFPGKTEEEYRHSLGSFGLSGPLALQTIRTLSGGQKSRLVFTLLSMEKPQIMILDEPTNHLDMDTIDALVKALGEYSGGVLVVSHDKRFIDQLCGEIWVCDKTLVKRFEGSIHEYAQCLLDSRQ